MTIDPQTKEGQEVLQTLKENLQIKERQEVLQTLKENLQIKEFEKIMNNSVQDRVFAELETSTISTVIFTTNGVKMEGPIERVDQYCILFGDNLLYKTAISTIKTCGSGGYLMVFKSAISTIRPDQKVKLPQDKTRVQDPYLNFLRKNKIRVQMFLTNGVKLFGYIQSFDSYTILFKPNNSK